MCHRRRTYRQVTMLSADATIDPKAICEYLPTKNTDTKNGCLWFIKCHPRSKFHSEPSLWQRFAKENHWLFRARIIFTSVDSSLVSSLATQSSSCPELFLLRQTRNKLQTENTWRVVFDCFRSVCKFEWLRRTLLPQYWLGRLESIISARCVNVMTESAQSHPAVSLSEILKAQSRAFSVISSKVPMSPEV